jgi:predicted CoA-binding protein
VSRELTQIDDVVSLLRQARTIAVLGAHPESSRPAHYVPEYLFDVGYRVLPVNPRFVGHVLFGAAVRATLAELGEPIDIVDVFRPAEALPLHVADVLAMGPAPRAVWFQQGIRNDAVARQLITRGIEVVQDRCTLADHRRFGLPRVTSTP